MTKTLKDLFEVYKPKSPDEQKFVDKHVTIKHKDRNGNGDDVFNGNTKYIKRKEERHGYDVNDDEKVYEEVEDLDELSSKTLQSYADKSFKAGARAGWAKNRADNDVDYKKANDTANKRVKGLGMATKKLMAKEEVEDLEELSRATIGRYSQKAKSIADNEGGKDRSKGRELAGRKNWGGTMSGVEKARVPSTNEEVEDLGEARPVNNPEYDESEKMWNTRKAAWEAEQKKKKKATNESAELDEKKLTPAEMKKREEIAKAMERENPGMDKSKKMAIATATAKRVAEEAEELDELSNKKMSDYMDKASDARGHRNLSTKKVDNRYKGVAMAAKKMAKEEVEQVDELSKGTLGSYVNKAAERIGTQGVTAGLKIASDENSKKNFKNMGKRQKGIATAMKKLTKEEIIDRAINKYMPELEDYVPMTQEEKLVAKLEHLPEAHILTLLSLYENLNEDNRSRMMMAIDTQEGINGLIDFAIQNNRGE